MPLLEKLCQRNFIATDLYDSSVYDLYNFGGIIFPIVHIQG